MPLWRRVLTTAMQSLPWLQRQPPTSYECWTLLFESLVTPRSLTTDCHDWCISSWLGWTSLSESVTSWAYWLTGVCSAKRQCTCPTDASQLPELQHVGICALPHVISWPYCNIILALMVVGHSHLLVYQMICEIPQSAQQPLHYDSWRHTCSLPSVLEVSHNALYKSALLTYWFLVIILFFISNRLLTA